MLRWVPAEGFRSAQSRVLFWEQAQVFQAFPAHRAWTGKKRGWPAGGRGPPLLAICCGQELRKSLSVRATGPDGKGLLSQLLEKEKEEDQKFKARLDNLIRPCFQN